MVMDHTVTSSQFSFDVISKVCIVSYIIVVHRVSIMNLCAVMLLNVLFFLSFSLLPVTS